MLAVLSGAADEPDVPLRSIHHAEQSRDLRNDDPRATALG